MPFKRGILTYCDSASAPAAPTLVHATISSILQSTQPFRFLKLCRLLRALTGVREILERAGRWCEIRAAIERFNAVLDGWGLVQTCFISGTAD